MFLLLVLASELGDGRKTEGLDQALHSKTAACELEVDDSLGAALQCSGKRSKPGTVAGQVNPMLLGIICV